MCGGGQEVGPGQDPVAEEAVAVLRDEEDPARQVPDLPPPAGGAAEFAAQSQCVCTAAVHPTGATLTTGCNDYLVSHLLRATAALKCLPLV